jgi:membrane protein required for colicin V production
MTGFDFVVFGILSLSLVVGVWRGLVHELMALLGWPFAFVLCKLFAGHMAWLLPIKQDAIRLAAAYVLLFVAALVAWGILTRLLVKLLKVMGAGWPDRVMGGVFGLLRGGAVLLAIVWLVGLTPYVRHPFWRNAATRPTLERAALLTKSWLPDNVAKLIDYGARK